jgi:hypothetical protein
MKPYMTRILGFDVLGAKILALQSVACALSTATMYDIIIRRYFDSYEHRLAPLPATPARMAVYVAWLGRLRTIKASSLQ